MTSPASFPSSSSSAAPRGAPELFIGLMSGTSMDGVDGVLLRLHPLAPGDVPANTEQPPPLQVLHAHSLALPDTLRQQFWSLNSSAADELHRAALAANALARLYAQVCQQLLAQAGLTPTAVRAIGAHGQTVRHRPGPQCGQADDPTGYSWQLNNPALLAELTGIDVVADFRSRDIAAGGQGAPLVPAFHQQVFGRPGQDRAVLNLGGIANLTLLPGQAGALTSGFDCGPANALLDHWALQHLGHAYDAGGAWAATGECQPALLQALLDEAFFRQAPPKSTGRDLFNPDWLQARLARFPGIAAQDVQATLLALTAHSAIQALAAALPRCTTLLVCGGGAFNHTLMAALRRCAAQQGLTLTVDSSASEGLPPMQVEAAAFGWLAAQQLWRQPANLPAATGARGPRLLGALYPA